MGAKFQEILAIFSNFQLYSKFFIIFFISYIVIYVVLAILFGLEIIKWPADTGILSDSGPLRERYMCSAYITFVPFFLYAFYNYLTKENDLGYIIKSFTENGALGWGFLIFFSIAILFFITLVIYFYIKIFREWYYFIKYNNIGVILIILFDLLFPFTGVLFFLSDPMNNLVFIFIIYGSLAILSFITSEDGFGERRTEKEEREAEKMINQNYFEHKWANNKRDYEEGNISEETYEANRNNLLKSREFDSFESLEKIRYEEDE